jgi:Putative Actinobacterial Holin-X, holin superfamily III
MSRRGDEDHTGIIGLVKETAEGLGKLLGDHVRLARIELVADVKSYARELTVLVTALVILSVGYAFGWVAVGLALTRVIGAPLAFAAIAALHLVAGAIAAVVAVRRARATRPLQETALAVERSVNALKHPVLPPPSINGGPQARANETGRHA